MRKTATDSSRRLAAMYGASFLLIPILAWLCLWAPAVAGEAALVRLPDQVGVVTIRLKQPLSENTGGLFAHDLNGDGMLDFLVTSAGHIAAYRQSGEALWVLRDEIVFFDQAHHPSAVAGDMDGDGREEVAYLTRGNKIKILDAATGKLERTILATGHPRAMAIANLRGLGDRDLILQDDQTHIRAIRAEDGSVLWESDEYRGVEHSPLRQADLDGDGLDEIAGASIIDHDGRKMNDWDLGGAYRAMDSIVIADVLPGLPLEVVLAEQRGANSHTDLVNPDRIVWRILNPWQWEDPDKLAVGDFDPERFGLEIYNRSSGGDGVAPRSKEEPYVNEEGPWVLDARGELLAKYYVNDFKPEWWTGHGLEEICRIDWDGDQRDEIAGKERHKIGAVAIVNPISGAFELVLPARALRLYVADVLGDSREEMIVLDADGTLKIFFNKTVNTVRPKASPWKQQHYRRQKQNWNYYSP